ncbi:hypothetical protein Glove_152g54 [Diversispora epigaea]|uniref:Uncharacterized protein n=1 Tax=Diversispora epigaea TaxID=1348612 RepID=A0A397IZ80_9GLOM|nr:hypothetical protein Glove_152g53 [Diversispora epigaea]RHZ79090.1 hypothetical protein Glove_152g54 [Diversispora epigaea]
MSDLNQLFKRKNQPSLRTNSRPSSSFSSSSSFSRPTLESEDSGLTGLTGSTGLTSRNNDGHRWEPFYHKKIRVDVPPISIITEASKISAWKKNLAISNSFRKLFDKVKEDEEDTYMIRIIKNVISIAEIILNPNNENIKISEEIIKPVLLKNLNKIENNESFEYESNSPERLEVTPKRLAASKKSAVPKKPAVPRNEENDDDDDEADKGDKAYEANEAYETDEGDEYYNEIINIDESEEE